MTAIIIALCLGICLSAACGLRVFLPFLVASIACKCGGIELKEGFQWIGTWPALIVFSTATIVEIAAYYVPWLDNSLDAIATPAAGIAGTLMTVAVFPSEISPLVSWALGIICGGGVATTVQLATVGTRALSTTYTGGMANPLVSTGEAIGSSGISIAALFIPVIVAIVVVLLTGLLLYFIIKKGINIFSGEARPA